MKKIISVILAMTICLSMFAGITVSASATVEKEYVFGRAATGKNGVHIWSSEVMDETLEGHHQYGFARIKAYGCTDDTGTYHHGWKYFDVDATVWSWLEQGDANLVSVTNDGLRLRNKAYKDSMPAETKIGVELEAPSEAGYYVLSSKGTAGPILFAGPKLSDKKTIEDYITTEHQIGNSKNASTDFSAYNSKVIYTDGTTPIIFGIYTRTQSFISAGITEAYIYNLKLTKVAGPDNAVFSVAEPSIEIGVTTTASIKVEGTDVLGSFVTYSVEEGGKDFIDIDPESGVITAKNPGPATVVATVGNKTYTTTVTVNAPAPAEDPGLTDAFSPDDTETVEAVVYTDKVTALPYVDGAEVADGVTATATQLSDGTYRMSTSTANKDNTFLYWAKGLDGGAKRVVSREESFIYTPTGNVVNYLIAVYEKNGATSPKAEFYNANGLLYGKVETATGTTPELPSMAGYGAASCWVAEDGTTYAGNVPITVNETMMLIAKYDDPSTDITITTDGCTTDKTKYAYGDIVTCTPNGTGTFYAWEKDGEIVSIDSEEYRFSAWENCTVKAIYKEHTPITSVARKIIIDVFGSNNNVMAEFIGFDDAVEKGIILGTTKIAMTSKKSQFTVELGDATSAKGYAVIKNSDGTYTEYTDGSYTK